MSLQRGRLVWAMGIFGGMFLVIYFPADDHFFRLVIDLLVLLATGLLFTALAMADRGLEPAVAAAPVTPAPSPVPEGQYRLPPSARPAPTTGLALTSRAPAPTPVPCFGGGSKAQRFPWLLPPRPAVSGVAADEAQLGDLAVRAASLVGPGHRCQEPATARQDAYRIARDASGRHLLLAVADGVSSSAHAELGAAVAAGTAVNHLRRRLDDANAAPLSPTELFDEAATAMLREAARRGLEAADVCAVLLVALIPTRPDHEFGERTMWAAWLGDASLWRLDDKRWQYAAGDRKGATPGYDSNAVAHTLPADPHAATETRLTLRPGDVISLVTDGLGDGLATIDDLNTYLAGRWRQPLPVAAYLNDVGFDAERFLDDRTSITVWIDPAPHTTPLATNTGGPQGPGADPAGEPFAGPDGWPS
ncbi:protein phosphatase 2C domain-containing protein [Streptomyces sp. M41]|uniref:protein phosphatase 2C domain-containing protein n=1 Tax=Streptomyces sp. M41 TaxID=3059412 RepID=UPI00374DD0C8